MNKGLSISLAKLLWGKETEGSSNQKVKHNENQITVMWIPPKRAIFLFSWQCKNRAVEGKKNLPD